jgi:hypothetical protein
VALDWASFEAEPVVALGGVGDDAAEAAVEPPAETIVSASRPQAINTTAAATRVLRMLPPFVSVQYDP